MDATCVHPEHTSSETHQMSSPKGDRLSQKLSSLAQRLQFWKVWVGTWAWVCVRCVRVCWRVRVCVHVCVFACVRS